MFFRKKICDVCQKKFKIDVEFIKLEDLPLNFKKSYNKESLNFCPECQDKVLDDLYKISEIEYKKIGNWFGFKNKYSEILNSKVNLENRNNGGVLLSKEESIKIKQDIEKIELNLLDSRYENHLYLEKLVLLFNLSNGLLALDNFNRYKELNLPIKNNAKFTEILNLLNFILEKDPDINLALALRGHINMIIGNSTMGIKDYNRLDLNLKAFHELKSINICISKLGGDIKHQFKFENPFKHLEKKELIEILIKRLKIDLSKRGNFDGCINYHYLLFDLFENNFSIKDKEEIEDFYFTDEFSSEIYEKITLYLKDLTFSNVIKLGILNFLLARGRLGLIDSEVHKLFMKSNEKNCTYFLNESKKYFNIIIDSEPKHVLSLKMLGHIHFLLDEKEISKEFYSKYEEILLIENELNLKLKHFDSITENIISKKNLT